MKSSGDRTLLIGAVLIALIIGAIVWFFAISPKLNSAQTAREEAAAQRDMNDILEITLLQRQKSAENMPEYTREIWAIRDILPPTESVVETRQAVNDIAVPLGLAVDIDRLSDPLPIAGGLSLQAPMEQVGLTSEIEGMTFATLLGTTYSLEVAGSADKILSLIDQLRDGDHRYLLVNSLTIQQNKTGVSGDIRATIGMILFTLDYGDPNITIRPVERPWPGTENVEEALNGADSLFKPIVDPVVV